jgi:hypothetical protein
MANLTQYAKKWFVERNQAFGPEKSGFTPLSPYNPTIQIASPGAAKLRQDIETYQRASGVLPREIYKIWMPLQADNYGSSASMLRSTLSSAWIDGKNISGLGIHAIICIDCQEA